MQAVVSHSRFLVCAGDGGADPVISVVVPAKPSHGCVRFCLSALLQQDIEEPYEIIVGSDEEGGLAGELRESFPQVQVCSCEPRCGPGGARNVGIEAARGRYIAFTDADCMPERDWLRNILRACRENDDWVVRGWVEICGSRICRAWDLAEQGMLRPRSPRPVPSITGANLCVARRFIEQGHARFAEGIFGAEEDVFLKGLSSAGRSVILDPRALVKHSGVDRLGPSLRRIYHLGKGTGLVRKNVSLRGSFFARHVWLVPLIVPARVVLTTIRVLRCGWGKSIEYIGLFPLAFLYWVWYAAGFAAGARSREERAMFDADASEVD